MFKEELAVRTVDAARLHSRDQRPAHPAAATTGSPDRPGFLLENATLSWLGAWSTRLARYPGFVGPEPRLRSHRAAPSSLNALRNADHHCPLLMSIGPAMRSRFTSWQPVPDATAPRRLKLSNSVARRTAGALSTASCPRRRGACAMSFLSSLPMWLRGNSSTDRQVLRRLVRLPAALWQIVPHLVQRDRLLVGRQHDTAFTTSPHSYVLHADHRGLG